MAAVRVRNGQVAADGRTDITGFDGIGHASTLGHECRLGIPRFVGLGESSGRSLSRGLSAVLGSVRIVLRRLVIPMLAVLAVIGLAVWVVGSLPRWFPDLVPSASASSTRPNPRPTIDVSGLAKVKVGRVVDGDTLDATLDGAQTKLRLLNIDAPETAHDGEPAQCLAEEAKAKLAKLAPAGSTLRIKTYGRDRFGRTLVGLYDGKGYLLNAHLVAAGLAAPFVVNGQVNLLQPVRDAQTEAAASASGLHQASGCTVPGRIVAAEKAVVKLPPTPSSAAETKQVIASAEKLQRTLTVLAADLKGDARFVPVDALTRQEVAELSNRVGAAQDAVGRALANLRGRR